MARRLDLQLLAAALLVVAELGLAFAYWHHQSWMEASLQTLLALVVATATWRITGHAGVAASAGLGLAVWRLPAAVGAPFLAAALVPTLIFLVPFRRRMVEAGVAAGAALVVAALALREPPLILMAAVVAGIAALARPTLRTRGALHALRDTALFAPAPALLGALFVNAVTGRAAHLPNRDAVLFGLALAGLLALASAALLGLSLLLQSTDPIQRSAWVSIATFGGVAVASLPLTETELLLPLAVIAGGPFLLLSAVTAARWAAVTPRFRYFAWSLPFLLGLAQLGMRA